MEGKKPIRRLMRSRCYCRAKRARREPRVLRAKPHQKSRVRSANTDDRKVSVEVAIVIAAGVEAGIVDAEAATVEVVEIVIVVIANHAAVSPRLRCRRTTRQSFCRENRFRNIA